MRYPLSPWIDTQPFGANDVDYSQFGLKGHHGIDALASIGTPVYAPETGSILLSQNGYSDPLSGKFVAGETIVLRSSYDHWLLHLSKRLVSPGQRVSEGQLIGYTGDTGFVTGPHLHYGIRPLNPNMNNGYRGFIDPKNVIEGASMEKINLNTARIIAYHILGRNGITNKNALDGSTDDDLNKYQVGQNLTNEHIYNLYMSQEARNFREKAIPDILRERDANIAAVKVLNERVENLTKHKDIAESSLAEANKEIDRFKKEVESLKSQVGDNSKWETFKALIRELIK